MMQTLPWIVAFISTALLAASLGAWAWRAQGRQRKEALPTDWPLAPRPVFSADERRVYRVLRDALPHHVLLTRLPLWRFCQPIDPSETDYWRELLGKSQVSFAVCSPNGRVLAAVDLDGEPVGSRRVQDIKQAALGACRVRYLRCAADDLPSPADLRLLVPGGGGADARVPLQTVHARALREGPLPQGDETSAPRVTSRPVLWRDSAVFQDSFFPSDDGFADSGGEVFEPAPGRHAPSRERSADARRRAGGPVDFEPTRQIFEEDEDDADDREAAARRGGSTPRFKPE